MFGDVSASLHRRGPIWCLPPRLWGGRSYEGPSVRQQSRLKELRRAAACSQEEEKKTIIMWTWPSLYDGSRTFSGDQSFFISSQRVTNSRRRGRVRGCTECLRCRCVLQASGQKPSNLRYNVLSSRFFFLYNSNRWRRLFCCDWKSSDNSVNQRKVYVKWRSGSKTLLLCLNTGWMKTKKKCHFAWRRRTKSVGRQQKKKRFSHSQQQQLKVFISLRLQV